MHESVIKELIKLYKIVSSASKPYLPVVLISRDGAHIRTDMAEFHLETCDTGLGSQTIIFTKDDLDKLASAKGVINFEPDGWTSENASCRVGWEFYKEDLATWEPEHREYINAQDFKKGLDNVKQSVAKTGPRQTLTYIQLKNSTFAGIDGYRIFTYKLKDDMENKKQILFHRSVYEILDKAIKAGAGDILIGTDEENAYILCGNLKIKFKNPDLEFMKWENTVAWNDTPLEIKVFPEELYTLLTQISKFKETYMDTKGEKPKRKECTRYAVFSFKDSTTLKVEMNLWPAVSSVAIEDEYSVELEKGGDHTKDFKIAFNPKYITEAIKPLAKEDCISIKFTSNVGPAYVEAGQVKNLVLPIRI